MADLTKVEVLVVGGGGAGGQDIAGGGGGGGVVYEKEYAVTAGDAIPVTVGAGGSRPTSAQTQGTGGTETETVVLPTIFDKPGIFTYEVKPGTYTVKIWGAGGGGSFASTGAGGACVIQTNIMISTAETWTISVGEGGAARDYNTNDLELGGIAGYGPGGNGATEHTAFNADFISAGLINTSGPRNTRDIHLKLLEGEVQTQYWLDNYHYFVYDSKAIYFSRNGTNKYSIVLSEKFRKSGNNIIESTESPRATFEKGLSFLYLEKESVFYRLFREGNYIYLSNSIGTKNLCRIVESALPFTLVFVDGSVEMTLAGTVFNVQDKNKSYPIPNISTGTLSFTGMTLNADFKYAGSIANVTTSKGSGGGGGAASGIKGGNSIPGRILAAGGGGGAGGFKSLLGPATGGGRGTGKGGTTKNVKFGLAGEPAGDNTDVPTVSVSPSMPNADYSEFLDTHGIWFADNNRPFEKSYSLNLKQGSYTFRLSGTKQAIVYVGDTKVVESRIWDEDSLPAAWDSFTFDQRLQWLNDNKVPQGSVLAMGFTNEEIAKFANGAPGTTVKYDAYNPTFVVDRVVTVSFNPGQDGFVTLRIIGVPNTFAGFMKNAVGLEIFSGETTVFSTSDISKYVISQSVSGGGGGGASCQNIFSASDIFPGDWYKKTAQEKIDWYNSNNITQDVLKYYGALDPNLFNLGYDRAANGYATDPKHSASGGEGGVSTFNNLATHFTGENSNTTGEVPKPGNSGDKDYRTGTGIGGPIGSKGGSGLVVIINTQAGGGTGSSTSSSTTPSSSNGGNSVFGKLVAIGGGSGAGSASSANSGTGGSGGGAASGRLAGKGTVGQGNDGAIGSTKCYDIDTFVFATKGSYSFDLYKSRAQNIMPLYTSNNSYTLPDTTTRYGLYRFPDITGLAYWTKTCLEQNWTINTPAFLNTFFTAVATYPGEASRALTSAKSQDTTSESGCGFKDGAALEIGGGGGGADGPGKTTGEGGNGKRIEITGSAVFYGGGGGGTNIVNSSVTGGVGGGGANGGYQASTNNGLPNTGGGGSAYSGEWGGAGNGGSGVVIVRYSAPRRAVGGLTTESGGYVLHRFTNVGNDTFRINKEVVIDPPPPIEDLTCEGDIALSEFYAGDSLVRAGTIGFPENIRTPIPPRGQRTIAVKNFYGAKTGEYTIFGKNPDTSANVTLWEQRSQVLFKVTSIKEVEKLYWSIESVELNQTFNPQIYPAQTIGNYKNFVNTTAPLVVVGGPYRGRVGLSKSGPIGVFAPEPFYTEIQLDEFGNYYGKPDEAFLKVGIYTYTFRFPSSNNYSYTGGNIRVWSANIIAAPVTGVTPPVIPPVLVAIPPTTTTTTTVRVYNTTINTDPVGPAFNLCSEVNVVIADGIPGGGVAGTIKGPVGSLTDGTGTENITPFNIPANGQVSIGKRKFSVPGAYTVTLVFSAPAGKAIQGGAVSKSLNFTVRPGNTLQVRSATGLTTFIEKNIVRVVLTGGNNDTINWSGPTTGSINLGPDGSETITLLEQGHTLPARDYEWTFVASNADAKTCNIVKYKIVLNESTTPPPEPEPPGPTCDTNTFNQTGSYEYESYGPKGMLMYDVGGSKYAAFQLDMGTVRGTTSARYPEKCYGDNTNGYAARSHWGLAAVHAGIVGNNTKVIIKIQSLGLKNNFRSSSANGVTSSALAESECAYKITKVDGTPRENVCPPSLNGVTLVGANGPIDSNNEVEVVGNGSSLNNIYGNATYGYVYFSDISKAVVHAGVLEDGETAKVKIYPIGNKAQFPGTTITTQTGDQVTSLGYDGDSCALKFSKVTAGGTTGGPGGPGPGPGTPSLPTTQCTPIDFKNCCPLVYTSAILNASTLYNDETKRATELGIPPGENFDSNGVVNIIPGGGGGTGTGLTKIATTGYSGRLFGDNTFGYAWPSKLNMALFHSGLVKESDYYKGKFAVKVINLGPKSNFPATPDPFGISSSERYSGTACAFRLELSISGSSGQTTPSGGGSGSTTGGGGSSSTTGGPGGSTPSPATTFNPCNLVPAPKITAFTIDQGGVPRWTITYNPPGSPDVLILKLQVVNGDTLTPIWTKNIDSRQYSYYADSLKLSTGPGKPIPNTGKQYEFQLVVTSSVCNKVDYTGIAGTTRPDGSKRTVNAFWFSSR